MAKGPWEVRVGWLLQPPDFAWKYKAPDTRFYGGQTRLDYIACDIEGTFWMVEVKQVDLARKTINLGREVSPGQRDALDAIASVGGYAVLAVGQNDTLYIFDWSTVRWWQREQSGTSMLPLELAGIILKWSGKKEWLKNQSLRSLFLNSEFRGAMTNAAAINSSLIPNSSPSISKPQDYTPTTEAMRRSARSFLEQDRNILFSAPFHDGGTKSSPPPTFKR